MSETENQKKDIESRNRIVSEIKKNFFVEAGAGSGKTTMLVRRMLAMVEAGIPIEKICAITFTKAAAGEFYDRFQKLLMERSNPDFKYENTGSAGELPKPTDESRKKCAEALEKIDLCFMGTIDSFCSMVLSEHPSEAKIPSDSKIISNEEAENYYKQEFIKICAGEYGIALKGMSNAFRSLHLNAEEVFAQGESILMNNRNVLFNYKKTDKNTDTDKHFEKDKKDILVMVSCLKTHQNFKYLKQKNNLEAWDKIGSIYRNLEKKWSSHFDSVLNALKELSNIRLIPEAMDDNGFELGGFFKTGGAKGSWLECTVKKKNKDDPDGLYEKLQNYRYSTSMAFLDTCVPVLEEGLRCKGYLTFFDYLYYLRSMLKSDASKDGRLISYIRERHRYFLIDEFQDTNPLQAEIFFYLSTDRPDANWSRCQPEPGSLFIVGDPKQSIYRFRSADVTSYLKVKKLFEEPCGATLSLSNNFRSTNILCKYFNKCFLELMKEENDNQSKFERIPVDKEIPSKEAIPSDVFQGIFTYKAYVGKVGEEQSDKTDPHQLVRVINTLVGNEKYKITAGNGNKTRTLRYSDIMVIVYNKTHLAPIMTELDIMGIPSKVEGDVPFETNEALSEIYKIYAAVADPDDETALYAALTGKIFGFSQENILLFKENYKNLKIKNSFNEAEIKDELCIQLIGVLNKLKQLHCESLNLTPAALFSKIMDEFRIYEYSKAENLEVMFYALELIRNAETSGLVISIKDGARFLYELISGESGEERCLSLVEARDAVHIANLHKVKGLEAPVVILAAAKIPQKGKQNSLRVEHCYEGSYGYLFSLSNKNIYNVKYFETTEFRKQEEYEDNAQKAEDIRLLYVAATRAKNALIICNSFTGTEKPSSRWERLMTQAGDMLKDFCISNTDEKASDLDESKANASKLYEEADTACVLKDRHSQSLSYEEKTPSHLLSPSKLSEDSDISEQLLKKEVRENLSNKADYSKTAHKFPDLLGTMTHKLMEMIVSTQNRVDTEKAIDEIIREYRTTESKNFEEDLRAALVDVSKTMKSGGYSQNNGAPQDLLNVLKNASEVYCEVPFCYTDNTEGKVELWNGVIDLIYCIEGKWHIVDYKTNADGTDLDKKYISQLEAYKKAFKANTGEDADALTYHIEI